MAEVFVLGVGMTAFGKRSETLPELMAEAAEAALKRSGRETLDAMYVGVMNPEEFSGESNIAAAITDYLGLWGLPATRVETASATGAAALHVAFYAVASGYLRSVLVLAGEKMTHGCRGRPGSRASWPRSSNAMSAIAEPRCQRWRRCSVNAI